MNIEALTLFNTSHHQSTIPQAVSSSETSRSSTIQGSSLQASFKSKEPDNDRSNWNSAQEISICLGEDMSDDMSDIDFIPIESPPSPHQPVIVSSRPNGSLHKLFAPTTVLKSEEASSNSSCKSNALESQPLAHAPDIDTSLKRLTQHECTRSSRLSNRQPPFSSNGLRSAEILQRHKQLVHRGNYVNSSSVIPSYANVVPTRVSSQHRSRPHVGFKYQVELEYMRSAVTAAGAVQPSRRTSSSNPFEKRSSSRKL